MPRLSFEYSEEQTPIGVSIDFHRYGGGDDKMRASLTLASEADGVTKVPMILNYSAAHELASAFSIIANSLKSTLPQDPNYKQDPKGDA